VVEELNGSLSEERKNRGAAGGHPTQWNGWATAAMAERRIHFTHADGHEEMSQ